MMKVKKFLSLLLCLAMTLCIGLAACGDNTPADEGGDKTEAVQLAAPQITLDDKTISWTAVEHADGYEVYEGANKVASPTATSYTITQTAVGTYSYTVYATSKDATKYTKSKASNAVNYTVAAASEDPVKLAAPVITLNGTKISWAAVEHADSYEVYEGTNKVASPATTSYDITQTAVGTYNYTVYAVSNDSTKYTKSDASNSVSYTVKGGDIVREQLAKERTIYVVGDSTVCDYSPKLDDYYLPRYGYGTQLFNYLNLEAKESQVKNLALSGRSSLDFLKENNYKTLKDSIKEGDYLIIGFGHNDEKDDETRFTDPKPDYQTPTNSAGKTSFQYNLYQNYVKLAKDKGATPILCTPIVRYSASGEYDGKSVAHVTADGDYPAAIIKLGADTNTAVVDLTGITKEYYKAHNDDAKYFHAFTSYTENGSDKIPDGMDATHINMYGAKMIAYWFATNLPADCALAKHVKDDIKAPTYEVDFPAAVKSDYTKPNYAGFNPAAHSANKVGTIGDGEWYHSAMGSVGGDSKVKDYGFANNNGTYTITSGAGGKFSNAEDGFGVIFTQIAITKNFTITAKVKVTAQPDSVNDQNAFGIMLRDDIYVDFNSKTILSNFVTASLSCGGKANMSRTSKSSLDYDGSLSYTKDVEYEITLSREGQVVTATVTKGSETKTTVFKDISFVGVDNNYFYLCLFANRGLKVEFSNVTYKITGDDTQGA